MTRRIAERTNSLSIYFLKKHKYLPQNTSTKYGGITWTRGNWSNNIDFIVNVNEDTSENYIELIYTVTIYTNSEKHDMRYKVPLTTTPCNYGGKRYWFKCNLYKNGVYCGRRVGVLYSIDKWFGCRHCADIAYSAQFEGGCYRVGSITEPEVEKAYHAIKRLYYNNKPTKSHKRYLRLAEKMDNSWKKMFIKLSDKNF